MFCSKCGAQIFDGASFCTNCGAGIAKEPIVQVAEPVAEPVVEPVQAAVPVAEPVVEPVQAAEPVAEPVQAAEPVAEPVQAAEPVAEPIVEPVAEPAAEPVITPQVENIYQQPPVQPTVQPQPQAPYVGGITAPVSKKNAITSMALGIAGCTMCMCVYFGVVALVLGIVGTVFNKKAREVDGNFSGFSKAGKVTSLIALIVGAVEIGVGLIMGMVCVGSSLVRMPQIIDEIEREAMLFFGMF